MRVTKCCFGAGVMEGYSDLTYKDGKGKASVCRTTAAGQVLPVAAACNSLFRASNTPYSNQ